MNATQIIASIPEQAQRSVLFSLVGSLNASVIGSAQRIAAVAERTAPLVELTVGEVKRLVSHEDDMIMINAQRTARCASNLRAQLQALTNNDEDGDLLSTLSFMTKPSAKTFDPQLINEVMKAAGIDGVDPKLINAMNRASAVQRAERLAKQQGSIEWVIDHVLTSRGWDELVPSEYGATIDCIEDNEDDIESLSADMQARLHDKLHSALNKARDTAVLGVLNRDRRYSLGDLPLIAQAIKDVDGLQ